MKNGPAIFFRVGGPFRRGSIRLLRFLCGLITEKAASCKHVDFLFEPSNNNQSSNDGGKTADGRLAEFQQYRIADSEGDAVAEHDAACDVKDG